MNIGKSLHSKNQFKSIDETLDLELLKQAMKKNSKKENKVTTGNKVLFAMALIWVMLFSITSCRYSPDEPVNTYDVEVYFTSGTIDTLTLSSIEEPYMLEGCLKTTYYYSGIDLGRKTVACYVERINIIKQY